MGQVKACMEHTDYIEMTSCGRDADGHSAPSSTLNVDVHSDAAVNGHAVTNVWIKELIYIVGCAT